MATVDGLHVEVADLPGDRRSPRARAPARGARIGGAVARLPAGAARGDRPARGRLLALRPRPLGPAARPAHAGLLPRGGRGRAARAAGGARRARTGARRPQRRRLDRARARRPPPGQRPGAAGAARLRRGGHGGGDPRHAPRVRGGRAAGADGPPSRRSRRRLPAGGATCGSIPAFRDWSLEPEAEAVTAPALLIQGADDPYGSLDQLDRIQARVRGPVSRLVVPGGHSPHLEQPETVVAAIAEFAAALP